VNKINRIKDYWQALNQDPSTKKAVIFLRRIVVFVIIGIIIYQLFLIGWREVLTSLPVHPLFYVIFFILYVTLPIAEIFIYRQVWKFRAWEGFKAFITKKVYNDEVMGYSGDFYLFVWIRKKIDKSGKEILKNIRDNVIISGINSNSIAVLLIGILIYVGQVEILDFIDDLNIVYVGTGVLITMVLIVLIIQFRKYLFDLPLKKALIAYSIYFTRFIIHHALLILQWAIVIPNTPMSVWLTFIAVLVVVNRIPFLPSKDFVFLWFGIELSRMLNMATASVAGMLLVSGALAKVTNLILFSLISYYTDPEKLEEFHKTDKSKLIIDDK
jgi:hypothetical protein